jgi:hypothetical protein
MGTGGVIVLESGGICIPPAGQYLITTGQETVLQWYDPLQLMWRTFCQSGELTTFATDGSNYRLVNQSGVIVGASITNAGSGGVNGIGPVQTGSTITFATGGVAGVLTAQGYVIVGGSVPAPTVTQGGSGFLVPPLILCDPPPPGGIQATFISTISAAGVLTGVTQVNAGAGYTSIPQFYVVPQFQFYNGTPRFPGDTAVPPLLGTNWPPGLLTPNNMWNGSPFQGNIAVPTTSGVLLTGNALTGSGTLTGIVVTHYGGGYTGASSATVTFGGTSLGAAAATAIFSFCLTGTSITATGGTGFIVGEGVVTDIGTVQQIYNNSVLFSKPGRGVVTTAAGPVFTVEDPGFGLQKSTITLTAGTALSTVPTGNLGGINDPSVLQGMVQ